MEKLIVLAAIATQSAAEWLRVAADAVFAWLDSFSALVFVATVAGIYLLLRSIFRSLRKSWPAFKSAIAFCEALFRLPVFMTYMETAVAEVRHEVFPNNGGSLRDDVDTLMLQGKQNTEMIKQLTQHDKQDHERLEVIEDELKLREERRVLARSRIATGEVEQHGI